MALVNAIIARYRPINAPTIRSWERHLKSCIRWAAVALSLCVPASAIAAPPADGQLLFRQRCQACHSDKAGEPAKVGPNLAGVVGRKAASTQFNYSAALKGSGLTWSKENLDRFLAAPSKAVPGTRMVIPVTDAGQRKALIDYLGAKR